MKRQLNISAWWSAAISAAIILLFGQCAREVNPTGGLRDSLPPVILRMKPENKTVNFENKKVILQFDEYISLKAVTENLIISPPSDPKPEIKQSGKRLIIDFSKCSLADSTTYSLDFGSSITDLNEGNILTGFNYIFSTGPDLDSLHITGQVKDVRTGTLLEKMTAALYADLADSAPARQLPDYIAKTDKDGKFLFNTVKKGSFRLIVFDDANRNLKYDSQTEPLAFCDSVLVPTAENTIRYDTISSRDTIVFHPGKDTLAHTDTLKIDSVVKVSETVFLPSPLELLLFEPRTTVQFIKSYERMRREKVTFIFNQPLFDDSLSISLKDSAFIQEGLDLQLTASHDTATVWITDKSMLPIDTLTFLVRYYRYDSLQNKIMHCDTITPRYSIRKDKFKGLQSFRFAFSVRNGSSIMPSEDLSFESSLPSQLHDAERLRLYTTIDTVGLKNRRGQFYPIDTALKETIVGDTVAVRPRYMPDSAYSGQRVVQYAYAPNRFMIRFGLPVQAPDIVLTLAQMPDLKQWCRTEFVAEENALYAWITDAEALKYISPQLKVSYRASSGEQTEQLIALRKGKESKKRKSPRASKLSIFVPAQQQEMHFLDEKLEAICANPLVSIDTSLMSLSLAGDTAMAKLPALFTLDPVSSRKVYVSYQWEKGKSYVLNFSKGACTDIYGEVNKEFLASIKTQANSRHKITTPVSRTVKQDSLCRERYRVSADWDFEKNYRFVIADSAFVDMYGVFSDSTETDFTITNPKNLSTLEVRVLNVHHPIILEVMDSEMKQVQFRRYSADTGQAVFSFGLVRPATYGFRIIEDIDGSMDWTTGDYFAHKQPEKIRFSKEKFETKANKDHVFTWDLNKVETDEPEVPEMLKKAKGPHKRDARMQSQTEE